MNALEPYLAELRDIRASGAAVPETSGYGALATLLNGIGHHLKPKVHCFINLANTGAGIPDGGLFVASQLQKGAEPLPGQLPLRGALEVKAPSAALREVARSEQVMKYLEKYRQVLVTTYREFALVGFDAEGRATVLETYSLAATEGDFWALAAHPHSAANNQGERLTDFLKRAMLRQTQIAAPQELAWFLASYAREARARVEEGGALPALTTTRQALEQALGMTFEGERGEHFFRSTLVQTLFYGLFAAWVFWAEQHEPTDTQARFRWREAAWYLHIPILSKLYGDFASPSQLGTMHLEEVLDWAGEALDRVDRASFFATFEQQHAVQYFYEPFLEAFDPELRKQLGVWYTPPEIVKYMVARVDQVLRSELDIADGLADPRVVVLDPCCGTGAYLVEVLNKVAETLHAKGGDALIANDLKKAAMSRVFGFEILPAPFVISHLQIGLALDHFGAPFAEDGKERAGVFLTNALTGWEPPVGPKQHLLFPELEMERDAAADVKQKKPILVILGNPPYNGFAGLAVDEERDLVEAYRKVDKVAPPQGQGLNDLYVRFYRMAERRITEGKQGEGIVCFISNYSWLDGLSFTGMRERFLNVFDHIWVDCLNGDKYKTGKLTPEGEPDPSVFSTEHSREGIQVGTAVALLARRTRHKPVDVVKFRHFWGKDKLLDIAAAEQSNEAYAEVLPGSAWIYREVEGGLVGRPSPDYVQHVRRGNVWLSAGQHNRKHEFYQPQVTREVADLHLVESNVELFPLWLAGGGTSNLFEGDNDVRRPNLTQEAMHYLEAIRGTESDLFCHLIAALHAPAYRFENADALRQDWPRVPLPVSPDHLRESAALGKFVCHLLDVESSVDTVTTSAIRGELRPVGLPWKVDGGQIDLSAGDLAVTAGWGHAGQGGVTMPAKGRLVERAYADSELAAFREGVADLDPTFEQLMTCLGDTCLDVYLNDRAYWRCIPKRVWTYTIGGYQVIKKWLSYRERPLLGRDLTVDEARYVMEMARRITAILLLEPALDANYAAVKANTYPWPQGSGDAR